MMPDTAITIPYTGYCTVYTVVTVKEIDHSIGWQEGERLRFPEPYGYECKCGQWKPRLYVCQRRIVGELGPWIKFKLNGSVWVSGSNPLEVSKVPRGSVPLSNEECEKYWQCSACALIEGKGE